MCVVGTEDICIGTPVAYDELPSAGRRKELRQLLHVLQPLKRVTVTLQGEKYVTLSAVYPHVQFMLLGLKRASENASVEPCVSQFAKELHQVYHDS